MDKRLVEFYQRLSKMNRSAIIKECFHYEKQDCSNKIISAHSVQRNGRLSLLEKSVKGNNVIYSTRDLQPSASEFFHKLKPVGIGTASTFFGFCGYHDTALFSDIENNPFDESDKHCFMHSYRALAYTYHQQMQILVPKETDKYIPYEIKLGENAAMNDLIKVKDKIQTLHATGNFGDLKSFKYFVEHTIPVACSVALTPESYIDGTPMNLNDDVAVPYSYIFLTVMPDLKESFIVVSHFEDDLKANKFVSDLENLSDEEVEKTISSLMIGDALNFFLSPQYWERLGKWGRRNFMSERKYHLDYLTSPEIRDTFWYSRFNFFESRHQLK